VTKRHVVESRIKAILGYSDRIPARVTQVRRITKIEARDFLVKNHLQDALTAKYRFGLFLPERYFRLAPFLNSNGNEEILVAVATFSYARIFLKEEKEHRSYEMVRFANLLNTTVVGGLDKLLKAFQLDRQPDDVMTYADLDWSEGRSYTRIGFQKMNDTEAQRFWLDKQLMIRYPEQRMKEETLKEDLARYCLIKNSGSRKFVKIFNKLANIV
jgi:hypothetical protein